MIQKHQRWIALFVVLTFMWLLQVSTMPLAAAGATEQASLNSAEQGPDFVEAVKHKAAPPPKKSILPLVLIGVGVVAVAAVLILVVFKTNYDITGTWDFVFFTGAYNTNLTLTFYGTKAGGNFICLEYAGNYGTYVVDGKKVTLTLTARPSVQFSGQFTDKDTITGTWIEPGEAWNFMATRSAATAALKPVTVMQTGPLSK